jgi:hypothetical protein
MFERRNLWQCCLDFGFKWHSIHWWYYEEWECWGNDRLLEWKEHFGQFIWCIFGHGVIDDMCNKPEHRLCWRCGTPTPYEIPSATIDIVRSLLHGKSVRHDEICLLLTPSRPTRRAA